MIGRLLFGLVIIMHCLGTVYAKDNKLPCKKILVITNRFPENSATAVLNQVVGLIEQGFTVHVYSRLKGYLENLHPSFIQYDLFSKTFFVDLPSDLNMYDIFLCQNGDLGKWFTTEKKVKLKLRGKVVTTFRGGDATKILLNNPHVYDDLFKYGDLMLPCCEYFKNNLILHGCPQQKIKVQHTSIDCNRFSYKPRMLNPSGPINIVTVCRLVERKGVEYVIDAIEELVKEYPQIRLRIVGFGPLERALQQRINDKHLEKNILLVGRVSQARVAEILDDSHIAVLASIVPGNLSQEGIPNALKEAMARGLPVIGTWHAGIPELIEDGVSGLLVPEKDVHALAVKIRYLITHADKWLAMGLAGKNKVNKYFDMKVVNKKLAEILAFL